MLNIGIQFADGHKPTLATIPASIDIAAIPVNGDLIVIHDHGFADGEKTYMVVNRIFHVIGSSVVHADCADVNKATITLEEY